MERGGRGGRGQEEIWGFLGVQKKEKKFTPGCNEKILSEVL